MQLTKTVYFRDYPSNAERKSGLTISFPKSDEHLYQTVKGLSSYNIREMLGFQSFASLEQAAEHSRSSVAAFARTQIRKRSSKTRITQSADRTTSLQVTFRGGKGSPLHDWYPYLEGYSPDFVNSIISEFAPNASSILDPFCGSGTTALVAALGGREGLYSEVNPVCQFVISTKANALKVSSDQRRMLSNQLLEIQDGLSKTLASSAPDRTLRKAYESAFVGRSSFNETSYKAVLRARTLANKLKVQNSTLADLFVVAVLRSLVPGSMMIRRGDLRFKTENELSKEAPSFMTCLHESLGIIASDLHDAETAAGDVHFVGEDARLLSQNMNSSVDSVITSPPYLNGTNYFRNTKLELWFLGNLSEKHHLRKFRDLAITSGINDVTVGKSIANGSKALPEILVETIVSLQKNTYDQRIPMMVESYFREMDVVLKSIGSVLSPNGSICIDLGDSCYGDVWVPTHTIIGELMAANGFDRSELVVLRERQSRGGSKLSQTLQVFHKKSNGTNRPTSSKHAKVGTKTDPRMRKWSEFRDNLPHQRGEMAKRNWGHPWHSLCSYQGKLKASIAHTLVDALLPTNGGKILDPFSGVGSIPFEARLQGHTAYGFDISPAAVAISRAKLESVDVNAVQGVLASLDSFIASQISTELDLEALDKIRFNGPLSSYFHPTTLKEIVAARKYFSNSPPTSGSEAIVLSALLHVLHGNRPYSLSRKSHPITPFSPTGEFEYRGVLDRVRQKLDRAFKALVDDKLPIGKSYNQDATADWPKEVTNLDAIITSPPFFDSTRFHTANWMRLWFSGWNLDDFKTEPASFVDELQKQSFEIYNAIFEQGSDRLKSGGMFAVHLGKSKKCDMAHELTKVGRQHLHLVDSFAESVDHCESHGIRDKGTVTHHQYLLFQKR